MGPVKNIPGTEAKMAKKKLTSSVFFFDLRHLLTCRFAAGKNSQFIRRSLHSPLDMWGASKIIDVDKSQVEYLGRQILPWQLAH